MKPNYQMIMEEMIHNLPKDRIPTLLLHSCCGPCSSYVLETLSKYFKITIYYYNPNIAPLSEFDARLKQQKRLLTEMHFQNPVSIITGDYNPEVFEEKIKEYRDQGEGSERCFACYRLRLTQTVEKAKELGFDYFTTTLSISPYKNATILNEIGKELEEKYKVAYLYADFKKKDGYKKSIILSEKHQLYRQNYCGCIYSKKEALAREKGVCE